MSNYIRAFAILLAMAGFIVGAPAAMAFSGSDNGESDTQPVSGSVLYKDADKAVKAEKYRDAIGLLERLIASDTSNADAYNLLGFSHRKLGEFDKAKDYYDKALAINPDHKGANEYLGELFLQIGELANAEARLAKLNQICVTPCEEYAELKEKIEAYKKSN